MDTERNAPSEVAHTGQGGAKSDSNPLAELAGTGQCGAGTEESRMTSGTMNTDHSGLGGIAPRVRPEGVRRGE